MSIEYTKTVRIVFMKQLASYVQVVKLLTLEKKNSEGRSYAHSEQNKG